MLKFITLRIFHWKLRNTLPKLSKVYYKKIFNLTYRFFIYLKPSQLWIIILALLNKTELPIIRKLLGIPSMFILFSSLFSDFESFNDKLDSNVLYAKLEVNKFADADNKWENFFWVLIILALLKRFITVIFKFLWIPFKIAFIYYIFKYFGFDFYNIYNILNTLSLGVIDWFYNKIIDFLNLLNKKW